jgi:S-adenosyl-L-methionine hydrolase (adenosine-forming)
MPVVTFTTDFGSSDAYVGAMKGVVLSLAPRAVLVDITHAVPPQDIRVGALTLAAAAPYFPPGSIHVAVVDPGVGGGRDAIAVAAAESYFVGPDNGLLSLAVSEPRRVFRIERPSFRREVASPTFHGRDIFAVAAGQIAAGHAIEEAGPSLAAMTPLPLANAGILADDCVGEVLYVDHFGNLVTSFSTKPARALSGRWELHCDGRRFELTAGRTFSDVDPGRLVLYAGSAGWAEVAVRDGSASALIQAKAGSPIRLQKLS